MKASPLPEPAALPLVPFAAAAGSSGPYDAPPSSSSKRSAAAGPEGRHAVMQYIRAHSPEVRSMLLCGVDAEGEDGGRHAVTQKIWAHFPRGVC